MKQGKKISQKTLDYIRFRLAYFATLEELRDEMCIFGSGTLSHIRKTNPTLDDVDDLRIKIVQDLYRSGLDAEDVAKKLKITVHRVQLWLIKPYPKQPLVIPTNPYENNEQEGKDKEARIRQIKEALALVQQKKRKV